MREILFRGKRVDNGKWEYGYYVYHIKRTPCPIGDWVRPEDEQHVIMRDGFSDWNLPRDTVHYDVDPTTVCQYIGLEDKNGKRIFEGDVVNFKTTAYAFERCYIRWHEKTAQFVATERNCIRTYPIDRDWEFEIIGNIHDNPELLREA